MQVSAADRSTTAHRARASRLQKEAAEFIGANEAGTRAFFLTTQPLVSGDTDAGNDLYMAEIGCPAAEAQCEPAAREVSALVQISHSPSGEAAEVQGASVLSMDGERAYFVARGVLSGANAEGAAPVKGADNLYVYDARDGTTHLVADLCSGPGQSGAVADRRCPNDLSGTRNDVREWSALGKMVQTTADGGFLLFASYARLVPGDTDTARDVYRYDAQTETLDRVSAGEEGYDANGNNDAFDAAFPGRGNPSVAQTHELGDRAISEDGSRIVFETADPLSPHANNHLINAYEWHKEPGWGEGRVALVSTGEDEQPVGVESGDEQGIEGTGNIMITPSGRDIFFMTTQSLVPQDTDGAEDVYDARLGPGFPSEAAKLKACTGDACQGRLTNPGPLLVPGSVVQAPGENFPPPAPVAAKAKARAKPAKCKRGGSSVTASASSARR